MVKVVKGVITNYTDLSLHSACANGNIGLVLYALHHSQPINSLLNGILPLHAAASSGNLEIVRILLEDWGAEVDCRRVSRRAEGKGKLRSTSGITVGTAGSTPLHFASANNHLAIVQILLSHGANPLLTDKYGITPEVLARQKGFFEVADYLKDWVEERGLIGGEAHREEGGRKRGGLKRGVEGLGRKLSKGSNGSNVGSSASTSHLDSTINSNRRNSTSSTTTTIPFNNTNSNLDSSINTIARRPSLPSVFEKDSARHHPARALKQALGMSSLLRHRSTSDSTSNSIKGDDEEYEEGGRIDFSQREYRGQSISTRIRTDSLDSSVSNLSFESRVSSQPSLQQQQQPRSRRPSTAPSFKTNFDTGDLISPSSSIATNSSINSSGFSLPGLTTSTNNANGNGNSNNTSTNLANTFYRPRQSSQLSGRFFINPTSFNNNQDQDQDQVSIDSQNDVDSISLSSSHRIKSKLKSKSKSNSERSSTGNGGNGNNAVFFDDETEEQVHSKLFKNSNSKLLVVGSLPPPLALLTRVRSSAGASIRAGSTRTREGSGGGGGGERERERRRRESSGATSLLSMTSSVGTQASFTNNTSTNIENKLGENGGGGGSRRSVRETSLPGEFGELELDQVGNVSGGGGGGGGFERDDDLLEGVATLKVSNRSGTLMIDPKKLQSQQQQQVRNRGDSISSSTTTNSSTQSFSRKTVGGVKPFTLLHSNSIDVLRAGDGNGIGIGNGNRNRSDSAGTDGRFSNSTVSSYSYSGRTTKSSSNYATTTSNSNSTAPTSIANSSPSTSQFLPINNNTNINRSASLSPLYESESNGILHLTSAQANAKVKKAERDLLSGTGTTSMEGVGGGGGGKVSLSQQLAAYGQSLAMERKVTAIEEGNRLNAEESSLYHYESIGGKHSTKGQEKQKHGSGKSYSSNTITPNTKSSLRIVEDPTSTSITPINNLVPTRRIVSSQNYLMPPLPSHLSKPRRSVSPATVSKNNANPRSMDIIGGGTSNLNSASLPSLPISSSSSSSRQVGTLPIASPDSSSTSVVLGSGIGGVSYVEAAPPTNTSISNSNSNHLNPQSQSHNSNHRKSNSSKSNPNSNLTGSNNTDHNKLSQRGTSVTSSEQILLDRAENIRIAAAVPMAPPPSRPLEKKKGFARRLFSRT